MLPSSRSDCGRFANYKKRAVELLQRNLSAVCSDCRDDAPADLTTAINAIVDPLAEAIIQLEVKQSQLEQKFERLSQLEPTQLPLNSR